MAEACAKSLLGELSKRQSCGKYPPNRKIMAQGGEHPASHSYKVNVQIIFDVILWRLPSLNTDLSRQRKQRQRVLVLQKLEQNRGS